MTQRDGIFKAIKVLIDKGHEVDVFTYGDKEAVWEHEYFPIRVLLEGQKHIDDYDVILHWADLTRPNAEVWSTLKRPMAICFAGGNTRGETLPYFDHVFVESEVYKEMFEVQGVSVSTAFGTNTELFDPETITVKGIPKTIDVLFPATYCEWKRHKLLTDACKGLSVVCCGFMYENQEQYCYEYPQQNGILTLPHVSANTLKHLLKASKVCLITSRSDGGSQRTVLESLAMNTPVVALKDSDKTTEYLRDGSVGYIADPNPQSIREMVEKAMNDTSQTRGYVLSKWTEHHYADALEEGLKTLLK